MVAQSLPMELLLRFVLSVWAALSGIILSASSLVFAQVTNSSGEPFNSKPVASKMLSERELPWNNLMVTYCGVASKIATLVLEFLLMLSVPSSTSSSVEDNKLHQRRMCIFH